MPYLSMLVFKSRVAVAENGCWLWTSTLDAHGYPVFGSRMAHRVSFEFFHKCAIPKGFHIHHECATPRCVKPEHLRLVTPKEHSQRHKTWRNIPESRFNSDAPPFPLTDEDWEEQIGSAVQLLSLYSSSSAKSAETVCGSYRRFVQERWERFAPLMSANTTERVKRLLEATNVLQVPR